jgi:hypothetical protein
MKNFTRRTVGCLLFVSLPLGISRSALAETVNNAPQNGTPVKLGTDTTINSNEPPTAPPVNSNPPLQTDSGSTINQPPITNQNNQTNYGDSTMSYPNCTGTCVFSIGKINQQNQREVVAGVVWNITSPENTQAQTGKITAQAQSDKLDRDNNLVLMEKLTQAISSRQEERANGLAIMLAKPLGYQDHQKLIADIKNRNTIQPYAARRNTTQK